MMLVQLAIHLEENKITVLSYIFYKNKHQMDQIFKFKNEIIKVLARKSKMLHV